MKEFICIVCPRGCHLTVDDNLNVTGNTCIRGEKYGKSEATNPVRNVTSTVKVKSDILPRCPVKTDGDIPKAKIFECMKEINKVELVPPVHMGDVVIENVLGTGINVIATRSIEK